MSRSYSLASARPYAFNFNVRRTGLVLIDVQKDFVDADGFGAIQCGSPETFARVRDVVPRIKKVLEIARELDMHIFHTREGHTPDLSDLPASKRDRQVNNPKGHHTLGIGQEGPMGRLLLRGGVGHDIVDELYPMAGEVVVDKPGKGSFWGTDFHRKLMARGITHLIVCGVTTECCVTTTVREANDRGFECCILKDCTDGFDTSFVDTSLSIISAYDGLFGYTVSSQDFVHQCSAANLLTPPLTPPEEVRQVPLSLEGLRSQYVRGILDPIDVVTTVFDKIKESKDRHPNVWIHVRDRADVIEEARVLSKRWSDKALPSLYGIPFAVKDNFDVAGIPTTAACPSYAYTPPLTAPVVSALISAGALLIGKTNMDQLATGLSGCRSPYGNVASIYGQGKHISGGSSSGSGVAVAADLVSFSLGTDTAGSGRVPAAFNGIVGFKPTIGTVSARNIVPACKSLDTVSIFAHSTAEARRIWQVIDVYDEDDPYAKLPSSLPVITTDYRGVQAAGFTFACPPLSALQACSTTSRMLFDKAVATLRHIGGRPTPLSEAEYEPFKTATELLYSGTLVNERIACIGHEFISNNLADLHPTTQSLFSTVLDRETKPWDVFSDQNKRVDCKRQAQKLFSKRIDVMLLPTVPCHPTIEEMNADPIRLNAKVGEFTHFANVLDLCAISLNGGWYDGPNGKMPFGISLVAAMGLDGKLFDVAEYVEENIN